MYYRDYLGKIWRNSKIHDCQPIFENYRHWLLNRLQFKQSWVINFYEDRISLTPKVFSNRKRIHRFSCWKRLRLSNSLRLARFTEFCGRQSSFERYTPASLNVQIFGSPGDNVLILNSGKLYKVQSGNNFRSSFLITEKEISCFWNEPTLWRRTKWKSIWCSWFFSSSSHQVSL